MNAPEILVYVDLEAAPVLVGRLWTHERKGRESATFEYDRTWLGHPARFGLEPALAVGPGPFHTPEGSALFGALGDSAPDRWGRTLMRRAEQRRARGAAETPRTLREIDFLLGVEDEARMGALRFAIREGGPYLASGGVQRIPPLVDLPRLLAAAGHLADDEESEEDLRLLLAPGSSIGGVRPKAVVRDPEGGYAIAKFPHVRDEIDVVRWEAVALSLAERAGITVPDWRLEMLPEGPVLLSRRFDRALSGRIPFLSAMSMVGARDREQHSYMEIADALRVHGSRARGDMRELWRRVVFSILIANTDDHLRNHGFLYDGTGGWRLAPAYDLNPVPLERKPRVLTTAIDTEDGTGSIDLAMSVAEYFELEPGDARKIVAVVARAVSGWRETARRFGLGSAQIDRMASAFLDTAT